MSQLNIYTFRELSQMYIDGRPMPDVAFVTQTDAIKLQSTLKGNTMSEWITDRQPKLSETDEVYVWIMSDNKPRLCHYLDVMEGMIWHPLDKPEPYLKPNRYTIEKYMGYNGEVEYGIICGVGPVARHIKTEKAAKEILAIFENS